MQIPLNHKIPHQTLEDFGPEIDETKDMEVFALSVPSVFVISDKDKNH